MVPRRLIHCFTFRAVLAGAVALSPSAAVVAQQPADDGQAAAQRELDLRYATPQSVAAVVARPRQVLTAPEMEMLPYEVIQAAGQQEFGLDPLQVEELQVFFEPPVLGPPQLLVVLRFVEPFDIDQLKEQVTQHTEREELDGRPYLRSMGMEPSFYATDERTLLVGSDDMLRRAYEGRAEVASSSLVDRLNRMDTGQDIMGAVEFGPIRPFVVAQVQQLPPLPPALEAFRNVPNLIEAYEWKLNLTDGFSVSAVVYATDEQAAEELEVLVLHGLELWQQQMLAAVGQMEQSEDAIERALARYMERVTGNITEIYRPTREGNRLVFIDEQQEEDSHRLVQIATTGFLVALILPAVQAAREAARRNTSRNNLRQLGIGLHNHHDVRKRFPAQANYDEDGKPLLSWRVHILPYLGERELYERFRLDEPWDSEHNKQLIPLMPAWFADPSSPRAAAEHRSSYVAPHGPGLFMEGTEGITIGGLKDGTSKTIALVEVDDEHAPIWTKPEDIEVNRQNPTAGLGGNHPGVFIAMFADVHVEEVSRDIDPETLWAMFTRAGGEPVRP